MADPGFPPIDRELALQLDALVPPPLPGDFAARLAAVVQETQQVPAFAPLPPARWRAIGHRARLGIAVGSLALIGLGSVSAAAAGYLGEPVNRAVHRLPVVGKLIEKVIPEKRRLHHAEALSTAGHLHRQAAGPRSAAALTPRPAAADAPPIALAPITPVLMPGLRTGGLHAPPPWRYPGPLPRTFPPGPERRAAIAALRTWRVAHPLPPEVIARRQRQAAILAERRAIRAERLGGMELPGPARPRLQSPALAPDPSAAAVLPEAMKSDRPPMARGAMLDPALREQLRLERRRARIEARRLGLDPLAPRFQRRFMQPGPHPPGGFRGRPRWQD